jgi:hypothetical protein
MERKWNACGTWMLADPLFVQRFAGSYDMNRADA